MNANEEERDKEEHAGREREVVVESLLQRDLNKVEKRFHSFEDN